MKDSINNLAIRTAIFTLLIAVCVFSYGITLFGFIAPNVMGDFCDSLGATKASAMFYERAYYANRTVSSAHTTLTKFIETNNTDKIIKYAGILFAHSDYDTFITALDAQHEAFASTRDEYALGCDQNSFLKSVYIESLIARNQTPRALETLYSQLENPNLQKPVYSYFAFVSSATDASLVNEAHLAFYEGLDGYFPQFLAQYNTLQSSVTSTSPQIIRPLCFIVTVARYLQLAGNETLYSSYYLPVFDDYITTYGGLEYHKTV